MATIYCSNKLKDFIGIDYFITSETTKPCLFGDWNVHLFYFDRRKFLICVNNKSYYCLILDSIKKSDFKRFANIFIDRLISQLLIDKIINPFEVPNVTSKLIPFSFSKTNNDRKTISTMNEFIYMYKVCRTTDSWPYKSLEEINSTLNDTLTGAGRNHERDYGRPIEDMRMLIKNTCA
ncbi:MAG: hypothetical protein H7Z76_12450 [Methylotenera sp.]|nr:hypothetical protein [Flavobacterium sp.]